MEAVVATVIGFVIASVGYAVGRYDGKYGERSNLIRIIQLITLDAAPTTRYHILVVKNELCRKLREEWNK